MGFGILSGEMERTEFREWSPSPKLIFYIENVEANRRLFIKEGHDRFWIPELDIKVNEQ